MTALEQTARERIRGAAPAVSSARRRARRSALVLAAAWLGPALAHDPGFAQRRALAQGPTPAQAPVAPPSTEQRGSLEQLALAAARSALLDRVGTLPVGPNLTLADWMTRDLALDRAVRLWCRTQPRHGAVRHYSDGVSEADVQASPAELCERLLHLLGEDPAAARQAGVSASELRAAAAEWPTLWATGRVSLTASLGGDRPVGWENVTREGMELARRAAGADAVVALLHEAGRLRVGASRRLSEFLQSGEAVRTAVMRGIEQAATTRVQFAPDQVAVAEARLDLRELLRILTRAHAEQYSGDEFTVADFREMVLAAGRTELVGTGLAAPPSATVVRSTGVLAEYDLPAWVETSLRATGRVRPEDAGGTALSPTTAPGGAPVPLAEAARVLAIEQLARQVEALVIQRDVTVGAFVAYHQDLKDDIVLFLSGARPVGPARVLADGSVEATVELPLRRLWEIVRRKMRLEEAAPARPAEGATP